MTYMSYLVYIFLTGDTPYLDWGWLLMILYQSSPSSSLFYVSWVSYICCCYRRIFIYYNLTIVTMESQADEALRPLLR